MMNFRVALIAVLLFLVVMVDFTSRIMSTLADGVLVGLAVAVAIPLFRNKK
ncbi:DUF3927 family protein [Buttiauxella gaviniae]|uniref:DUF3927 family protein n=1 Tax=Buttiauxella gaviniae TaxID=82990 RepID=UPI003976D4B9